MFPEDNWSQKADDIVKYQADIFAMGEDWQGKFDSLANFCEVVYLPRIKMFQLHVLKMLWQK